MLAIQKVYKNGEKCNERHFNENMAQIEFINCLIMTLKKVDKCKITFDSVKRQAKANFSHKHILCNGNTNIYTYEYLFYNITNNIDL